MRARNILEDLPSTDAGERFEPLAGAGGVRIERIVSPAGHGSPEGFWYDQENEEWVLLVEGEAGLEIEGREERVELAAGDWVRIPAGCRHRVAWTAAGRTTVWLAVHYPPDSASSSSGAPPRRQ